MSKPINREIGKANNIGFGFHESPSQHLIRLLYKFEFIDSQAFIDTRRALLAVVPIDAAFLIEEVHVLKPLIDVLRLPEVEEQLVLTQLLSDYVVTHSRIVVINIV
jgi:hypothetical protein